MLFKPTALLSLGLLSSLTTVLATPAPRQASYHIAVADQNTKTIRVFPRDSKKWDDDAIYWSFTADPPFWNRDWANLDEIKFRRTANHGWIALVSASGGKAGIINVTNEKRKTDLDDVMWQATPEGNPHSIERIPHIGAIVVASSTPGKLTVYVPQDTDKPVDDFGNIKTSKYKYDVPGAHGVLWDPQGSDDVSKGFLWVTARTYLIKYSVSGKGPDIKLNEEEKIEFPGKGLGHDLMPDYTDPNVLLMTDTYGAYAYNTKTEKWTTLRKERKLKSIARHANGEYVWIKGDEGDLGQYVYVSKNIADTDNTDAERWGWKDARFYKAHIYTPDFE
jgi:hypothetical protein